MVLKFSGFEVGKPINFKTDYLQLSPSTSSSWEHVSRELVVGRPQGVLGSLQVSPPKATFTGGY